MMKVSIVLRVKNEGKTLDRVLEGVARQRFEGNLEILVVDSGSTDNTLEIAQKHGARIVHIPPEKFSWGYALNYGAGQSSGDVIVYLSGHCVPVDDSWLGALLEPFDDPKVAGVYSRHVPIPGVDPFEAVELEYFWFPPGTGELVESESFSNASCAVRRKTWEVVPFDETLLSCEDGEWAIRARNQGWKILYQPKSRVYHSHPPRLETIYLRWFWRCFSAKKVLPFTRDGNLFYQAYKTLQYGFLDLKYLLKHNMLSRFWRIPFYELVRQWGGYKGARAALQGEDFQKWNDVKVPRFIKWVRPLVEK